MSEAWGAVVAAIAAGVFGIIGILAGIYVGRRQTVDQAAVEHGQWLRGQRQTAYIELLDAINVAKENLEDIVARWDATALRADQQGLERDEFTELIDARVKVALEGLENPLERAHLLGPESVEQVVDELDVWAGHLVTHFHQQALPGAGPNWDWSTFHIFMGRGSVLREKLVTAAKATLRTPPAPGG